MFFYLRTESGSFSKQILLFFNLKKKYKLTQLVCFICCSNSNSNNDNWNGFDNSFETSNQVYQASSSEPQATQNSAIRKQHKSEKIDKGDKNDFTSLDVKASRQKPTNKSKTIEDDAWNLLNN